MGIPGKENPFMDPRVLSLWRACSGVSQGSLRLPLLMLLMLCHSLGKGDRP